VGEAVGDDVAVAVGVGVGEQMQSFAGLKEHHPFAPWLTPRAATSV
jgi:hypothetical protein